MNIQSIVGRVINSEEHLNQTFILRNKVLRDERQLFPKAEQSIKYEKDRYDRHSVHVGAFCSWGKLYGSVRLVLPSKLGLPLEDYCDITIDKNVRASAAEVSRLVIPRKLPNRRQREIAASGLFALPSDIALELYRIVYQEARKRGIQYLYAAMEKSLLRSLTRLHFPFHQVGETVDYHGPVAPFVLPLDQFDLRMRAHDPGLLKYFQTPPEAAYAYVSEKVVKDRATA